MRFRNLDSNDDWTFGKGDNNFALNNQAIGLNIRTRILSWTGDCFFATQENIDWSNRLGSKNQRALLEMDLRSVILRTEGVTGIVSLNVSFSTARRLTANFEVNTINTQVFVDSVEVSL